MVEVVTFSICAKERKMEIRVPLTDDLMLCLHRMCVCALTEGDLQAPCVTIKVSRAALTFS